MIMLQNMYTQLRSYTAKLTEYNQHDGTIHLKRFQGNLRKNKVEQVFFIRFIRNHSFIEYS